MSVAMPIAPAVFRQINDAIFDIQSSDYNNCGKHFKKLARLLHSPELQPISTSLTEGIDLDAWLKAGEATQGSMIGSATLDWPAEAEKELGTVILLIDRFADKGADDALNFAHTFYYSGSSFDANLHKMTRQVLIPFARDYVSYVKTKSEEWIAAAEAVQLLTPVFKSGFLAENAICKRAHSGLIGAQAERYMADSKSATNFPIPRGFWWAEGDVALTQNWTTGDFETWINEKTHLRAFGVSFLRADIKKMIPEVPMKLSATPAGTNVVIGHGRSLVWLKLKDFIAITLHLSVDEFNRVPVAGVSTTDRLSQMLDEAAIAFLIMTAEDEQRDGNRRARENVVHEIGLFQGRHGFTRAIVLVEDGCEQFSNIDGLGQIRFPQGNISAAFEEIRRVLERERLVS